jgi:hypothetical protein
VVGTTRQPPLVGLVEEVAPMGRDLTTEEEDEIRGSRKEKEQNRL